MTDKKLVSMSGWDVKTGDFWEGRELDAAVAEHVMGLQRVTPEGNDWRYDSGDGWWLPVPRFSSNIVAAMAVIEKMRESFDVEILGGANGSWNVMFHENNPLQSVSAGGDSLPDCICRAALATIKG